MDESKANEILEKLRNGVENEVTVTKEDFMDFRSVLIKQPDKTHFRGNAQKGGLVIYTYHETPL
ncbi:hypothetical protein [Bacillus sp. FJAT-45350]|uniref:hypothetical protein n=1 Tax=Bacillus sp. FJAT-45350 TaxID=2011014 RepID=UPI000BB80F83|nr:hypothetical protein [Bacillus sp. FJAT-45350]